MAAEPKSKKLPVPAVRLFQRSDQTGTPERNADQPVRKKLRRSTIDRHDIDEIEKELQFDLHRPLKDVLRNIFKQNGRLVITFPKTPRLKVSKNVNAVSISIQIRCASIGDQVFTVHKVEV